MNTILRDLLVCLLLASYSLVSFIPANTDTVSLKVSTTDNPIAVISEASGNLLSAALRTDDVFSRLNTLIAIQFRNFSKDSALLQQINNGLINSAIRFYGNQPASTVFRLFIAVILFPFHYFR
ncbi:MAG: hypothetical protein JNL47_10405 [Bacteroidia bacterium]|nr:hypothetical protein [Bacteroidia bacterium]